MYFPPFILMYNASNKTLLPELKLGKRWRKEVVLYVTLEMSILLLFSLESQQNVQLSKLLVLSNEEHKISLYSFKKLKK